MGAYAKPQQRKKEGEGQEEREIRSSLSILDLEDGKLWDLGKEEEGKTYILIAAYKKHGVNL